MRLSILSLVAWLAWAQNATIDGPMLGYVYDSGSRSLRPILGIAGSSSVGDPLALETPLDRAEISPRHDYALAVAAETGEVLLVSLRGGAFAARPLAGLTPAPDRIVLSPGGRSAALYSAGRNRVQIVTGLPDKAVLDREVDLSELVRPPSLLAINDEGNRVLAAAPDTDSTALYTLESGSPARYLMALGEVSAMAFAPNGTDAAIADRTRGLYRIRAADGAQDRMPAPVDNPTAVAFTDDGARLLAATPDSVVVLDAAGSELMRIPSNREPAGLHRMLGGLVFRLNDLGDEPLWLVDAGASEPRTVFVPFARSSEP